MSTAPRSTNLLNHVRTRLWLQSVLRAVLVSGIVTLILALGTLLTVRLLGVLPTLSGDLRWLWFLPAVAVLGALVFHRRVEQHSAARAVDQHAKTHDLFLTLTSLNGSAGEYQPLVTSAAESRADRIVPAEVAPFQGDKRIIALLGLAALVAVAAWQLPQFDPFGHVEAATKQEKQKAEIVAIRQEAKTRKDRLKKEAERAAEQTEEIDARLENLKQDFRKMQPKQSEANAKVLDSHRMDIGDKWKASASNEQLRQMMNQPISKQQLGGSRNQKMNEWLKDLQEGKTESLQQQLQQAQQTMQAMMEAKDPEERKKLADQLQKDLQDLNSFAKNKAGSKELANALSKAMKALQAGQQPGENGEKIELSKDAMEALKESLELSEQEMEKVAQAAEDMKKLEDALSTLQKAQELNQKQQLDGARCEGCETMEDYAELYAQMMGEGEGGEGDKERNEGGNRGVGRGGETPEDNSDPEGYKTEKEKPQVQAGKILLSIKTKEYAEEKDFDPEKMREYQKSISDLKSSVQSAIDTEEIPPGYVDGIKGYFDKIEKIDPQLKTDPGTKSP
ncbi:MAG: hypothetical protein R3C49_14675 [Planctomycetaceae bacterium]